MDEVRSVGPCFKVLTILRRMLLTTFPCFPFFLFVVSADSSGCCSRVVSIDDFLGESSKCLLRVAFLDDEIVEVGFF